MLDYLRKNNKKILAIIGVFLMIAFIVPTVGQRAGQPGHDEVFGRIGDEEIHGREFYRARAEWELLTQRRMQLGMMSIADLTLAQRLRNPMNPEQGITAAQTLVRRLSPEDYLLLKKEAQRMGVALDAEQAKEIVQALGSKDEDEAELLEVALGNWFAILGAFDRISQSAKISPAMATHLLANQQEQISLKLVQFKAEDFKRQVPPPSREQLEAFFASHRGQLPGSGEFGFGYRYPNRVAFQYIMVPREAVKQTVTMEDIYQTYKKNPEQYPTTNPTTHPTTGPAAAAATTQPRSPGQVLRESTELQDRIRNRIAAERTELLAKRIEQLIRGESEWPAFKHAAQAAGTTLPANPPQTSVGVPYHTYAYLIKLRERVQKLPDAHNVMPTTGEEPRLMSQKEIENLPGIGKSYYVYQGRYPIPFAEFITRNAAAFMNEQQRKQAQDEQFPVLALYEPSPMLRDAQGNVYIVRLVEASASHEPATLAEVEGKVREDYLTHEAYQRAKDAANQFLAQARSQGLEAAAKAAGNQAVIDTGLFSNDARVSLAAPKLPEEAYGQLIEGGFDLFYERLKSGQEKPMGVIGVPRAAAVMVAQLHEAKPATDLGPSEMAMLRREMEAARASGMIQNWFNSAAIHARLDYQAVRGESKQTPQNNTPTERPPIL